jgi:hypothetical protein
MATIAEMLMNAAKQLSSAFTPEDLTVKAHQLFPGKFSLRGYAAYPNHNRVVAGLSGEHGLVARGYLVRHSDGRLSLGQREMPAPQKLSPTPDEIAAYRRAPHEGCLRLMQRTRLSALEAKLAFEHAVAG